MKSVRHFLILYFLLLISYSAFAQQFTHADTLSGSNGPGRDWWDVKHYDLNVKFNLTDSSISGYNEITFDVSRKDSIMQIDLQQPLVIDSFCITGAQGESYELGTIYGFRTVSRDSMIYSSKRNDSNTYFLNLYLPDYDSTVSKYTCSIRIYYHGKPHIAKNAPWDGGMVFTKDKKGRPWISFACQGIGASAWFPCKDYQGDEPDNGVDLFLNVPDSLVAVANGRLIGTDSVGDGTISYAWVVSAPINTYDIVPYIGSYIHFGEVYNYKLRPPVHITPAAAPVKTSPYFTRVRYKHNGHIHYKWVQIDSNTVPMVVLPPPPPPPSFYSVLLSKSFHYNINRNNDTITDNDYDGLDMDYWVLDYDSAKAKKQFQDAPRMMKAFEYWFGPYPFYEDGYKLVEAPYLGMENQSDIAYGNGFINGYYGQDLSHSGWGLKWDFIIVHESAHEWFGNNITSKDIADMWIHEGFANYAEALFTEYYYGKDAGDDYVIGLRKNIMNDEPIIAPYGVNKEGSEDMYWKAANMIHMIRQVINDDSLFRQILHGLNKDFYHQTVTTQQIENYINTQSKIDFSKVFDQYLRTTQIPVLEYRIEGNTLVYHWTNCVPGFNLPLKINFGGEKWITVAEGWSVLTLPSKGDYKFSVDRNFYINVKKVD